MLQNERVSVYYGTKEAYELEKQYKRINENALYFVEGILYSGYELYSQEYKKVSSYPSVGQKNYIYINTSDASVAVWNNDTNEWIYICKPISNEIIDDKNSIATSAVVYKTLQEAKNYIDKRYVEVVNTMDATIKNTIIKNNEDLYNYIANVENNINDIASTVNENKSIWEDKYTKNEIDNKLSTLETNIDWKEAVETFDGILVTYPSPVDGWTVNVKDTNYTYRYDGDKWVAISANAIPKVTSDVDGLLSKEDYVKYEETYTQKHSHPNKSILDTITSTIVESWNSTVSHISDTVKHITSGERTNWNSAYFHSTSSHAPSNAEENQNAFSNVTVGSTTIIADSKTDTLTFVAGDNVTITPDSTNDKITISSSDGNVKQVPGTANYNRRILLSFGENDESETNYVVKSANFTANPATGAMFVKGFDRINITGQTFDVNTLTLSSGSPMVMRYIEKTNGGAANITNIPVTNAPFILDVELIRWASATDYITKQTFVSSSAQANEYVRYCNSGTWTSWTKRVFTDTNTTYSAATTSATGLMSASDKTKLDGIATGANKTSIVANLTTTTAGCALDGTMGKKLYEYIQEIQTEIMYLKYLTSVNTSDFTEAKYIKNHQNSELGSINYAYMPYDIWNALTTSNKVIVGFTSGAIGIFSIDSKSSIMLGRTITWIKDSVPYAAKTTIQGGTPTLALASESGGYCIWDDEIYTSTGEIKQTLVFEISASSQTPSVWYKII